MGRLQFTNEPPLARALQLGIRRIGFAAACWLLGTCKAQGGVSCDIWGFRKEAQMVTVPRSSTCI